MLPGNTTVEIGEMTVPDVHRTREAEARAMQVVYVLQVNDGTPDSDKPEVYYLEALAKQAAQIEAEKMGVAVPTPSSWVESDDNSYVTSKVDDVMFTIWRSPVHEF
jgi:hypothetical protein